MVGRSMRKGWYECESKFEAKWRLIEGDLYGHVSLVIFSKHLSVIRMDTGTSTRRVSCHREARLAPVSQHINVCGSNIVFGRCQPHLAASTERVFLQQANGKSSCRRIVTSKLLIYRSNFSVWLSGSVVHFVFIPSVNALAVNYGYCHRKPTSTYDARSMLERKVHWYRLGTTRKVHTCVEFTPVEVVCSKLATSAAIPVQTGNLSVETCNWIIPDPSFLS